MFKYLWIIILAIAYIGLWIYCIIDYRKNNNAYNFYSTEHYLGVFIWTHILGAAVAITMIFCSSFLTFLEG